MAKYRSNLPQLVGGRFLQYTGLGTELAFRHREGPPGFPAYKMLATERGRALLDSYHSALIEVARDHGYGVILDAPTGDAHYARAKKEGYAREELWALNRDAIGHTAAARDAFGDLPTVLAAPVMPRDDAYNPAEFISADEAEAYHSEQLEIIAGTAADLIDAFTQTHADEAIGIARGARHFGLPVVVSFTLAVDGRLPSGMPLNRAIDVVDDATGGYASYFLVNCVHPDHFGLALDDAPWVGRLRGIVANASKLSHDELDESSNLDAGDPEELGRKINALTQRFTHFSVVGGCCGTDMRHMRAIAAPSPP